MTVFLTKLRGVGVLALAALGLALSACSGGAPLEQSSGGSGRSTAVQLDTTATLPTEACGLLTAREVSELTGQDVQQQAQGDACRFVDAASPNSPEAVVLVSLRPASAFAIAQAGNKYSRRSMVRMTGLGREAYYDDYRGDLYVQLPERTLVIGMPRRLEDRRRDRIATDLGRVVLARLAARAPGSAAQ
ncbi:hypothetical protein MUN81_07810 [Hymenobacter sp. 5317J-9]|uniref:hypothetical protein n=1 Tax=Hymenobacter sp. 5317J-9 TaxID=2932250 RepID=UPI001FD7020A|nr:hypothetical protein [Hymenobacter sp. 5317J-9]UOQ99393.1 hypothetical protein MUN81_07810 [Hymenobacter sp. 5317J-9]